MASTAKNQSTFQHEHRLRLIASWFNDSLTNAQTALTNSSIVEIGCGQGDMTVALAETLSSNPNSHGTILAIDPAPLNYGAPETLGQAQTRISQSSIGKAIQWIQRDPLEFLRDSPSIKSLDFVVLAHSIWYLPSETYLKALLESIRDVASGDTKLLLSEWSMRSSNPAAQAHLFAVEAQALHPFEDGNVRTLIRTERIVDIAKEAGWNLHQEKWLGASDLDDGKWEVAATRSMQTESVPAKAREFITSMERACEKHPGIKSMDVWSGCFSVATRA